MEKVNEQYNECNFWERLEMFVANVQVSDLAGEEEKEFILMMCKKHKQTEE